MDVALHKCGVTFVLDRAGVTGDDGASHNGMWDMSILQVVPGLRLAAPRDPARLARAARRGRRGLRRPDGGAVPQGRAAGRHRGGRPPRRLRRARPQRHPRRADRVVRRDGHDRRRRRRAAGRPGHRRHRRRPALGQAGRPGRSSTSPASTGWSSASRTTAASAAAARCCCQTLNDAGVHHAVPAARHPAGVPRPRQARGDPRADRPGAAGAGPRHRRGHQRRAGGAAGRPSVVVGPVRDREAAVQSCRRPRPPASQSPVDDRCS